MPFLIGLQASLLPSLKQLPMDEVTLVDLDLGTCQPGPSSPSDDARLLPWADRLQAALQVLVPQPPAPPQHHLHCERHHSILLSAHVSRLLSQAALAERKVSTLLNIVGPWCQRAQQETLGMYDECCTHHQLQIGVGIVL